MSRVLKRQVFEIRFTPTHNFFDLRSALLDAIYSDKQTKKKHFEHWQLTDTRVDVFDADKKRSFFVSFQNCGFSCENPPTDNYAKDQLLKYVRLAFGVIGDFVEEIRRVGFRDTRVIPVRDFDVLADAVLHRFVKTDDPLFSTVNASVSDLQVFPLIFKQGKNSFQITIGPAKKLQLEAQLWGDDPMLPGAALYADIDYYAVMPFPGESIDKYVAEFINKASETQTKAFLELSGLTEGQE